MVQKEGLSRVKAERLGSSDTSSKAGPSSLEQLQQAWMGKPTAPLCPPVLPLFFLMAGKRLGILGQHQAGSCLITQYAFHLHSGASRITLQSGCNHRYKCRPKVGSPSFPPITSLGFPRRNNGFGHFVIRGAAGTAFMD